MEGFLGSLETLAPIEAIRFSRWTYAAINAGHVLAIALLVGGSVPLSLRLMGLWPSVPRASLVRVLARTAGTGFALAVLTGLTLFATRASEYALNPVFQLKLVLVLLGAGSAILSMRRYGADLADAPQGAARLMGVFSIACWIGALISGRLIAFVGG